MVDINAGTQPRTRLADAARDWRNADYVVETRDDDYYLPEYGSRREHGFGLHARAQRLGRWRASYASYEPGLASRRMEDLSRPGVIVYATGIPRLEEAEWEQHWVPGLVAQIYEATPTAESADDLAETFRELADEWKRDTLFISSIQQRVLHPAYQKIIGMGKAALPLVFTELRESPAYWFWALAAITREDPAAGAERMADARRAWLHWADEHGY